MSVLLASASSPHANIASEKEVLNYVYSGEKPAAVIARVDVDTQRTFVGTERYFAYFYINGLKILPEGVIVPEAGRGDFIAQCRTMVVRGGDEVSIRLVGEAGDIDVAVDVLLVDVGAIDVGELTVDCDGLVDVITSTIYDALKGVVIRPERVVLAPCKKKPVFTISRSE